MGYPPRVEGVCGVRTQLLFERAALARREGRSGDAEAAYREWMALDPADPVPRYALALLLLERGAYDEGWRLHESRSEVAATGVRKPRWSFPEWRGEPLHGKRLLVFPEQGL